MAHMLNMRSDGKASMMYYGEKPWHGLGVSLDKPATAAEAITAAGLDYDVDKYPILATTNGKHGLIEIPGLYATMRSDTFAVLGIVGERYEVLQNRDAFRFFDSLVGEGEAIYHTAGALGKGERIWILAKLPDYIHVNGDDIVEKYLLLTTGHDGQTQVKAKFTPIRVVCNNTLSAALAGSDAEISVLHTRSVHTELATAHKLLGLSNKLYNELGSLFSRMAHTRITDTQLEQYLKTIMPDSKGENNTRVENKREQIKQLYHVGIGAEMSIGTVWGAYNAVTEYADHVTTQGKPDSDRLHSVWYGSAARIKQVAFDAAISLMN